MNAINIALNAVLVALGYGVLGVALGNACEPRCLWNLYDRFGCPPV